MSNEYTIDHTEFCCVCGSPIWSETSIRRGYGGECAMAIKDAKAKRVFVDPDLKAKYYQIEASMLIAYISEKTFKSGFRKSFQESVMKQAIWLSKKQKDICKDILFTWDGELAKKFEHELHQRHEEFWDQIPVTREDIEIARQKIREKREEN